MRPIYRIVLVGAAAACFQTLTGCAGPVVRALVFRSARRAPSAPDSYAGPIRKARLTRFQSEQGQIPATLAQTDSGPGLLVCEPVDRGAPGGGAAFGGGCSRWLQFQVSAQGELGRTPQWSTIQEAEPEFGPDGLRAGSEELPRLARALGITHACLGEVRGSSSARVLTYRLVELPAGKAVGKPVVLSGSDEAVLARLPAAARELCSRLGVRKPQVAPRVDATPVEMGFLGALPWAPDETLPHAQLQKLFELSRRCSLAALLFLTNRGDMKDRGAIRIPISRLLAHESQNPMVLSEIGLQSVRAEAHAATGALPPSRALRARYPHSFLCNLAVDYACRDREELAEARGAAEEAVRCSTRSPYAWLALAGVYTHLADYVRREKAITRLTPAERQYCTMLYQKWLVVACRAASLDPGSGMAWGQVSAAAAFSGDGELADTAFWNGMTADPDDPDQLAWGLSLYQPKWYPDAGKAARVARLAVQASARAGGRWSLADRVNTAREAIEAGQPALAYQIARSPRERALLQPAR